MVAAVGVATAAPGVPVKSDPALKRKEALGRTFMQNAGQWDSRALFHASSPGLDYWIVKNGAIYDFHGSADDAKVQKGQVVRMSFAGASSNATSTGLDKNLTRNQFINSNGTRVAGSFGRVLTKDVYPGIDALHYYSEKQGVRYDMIVQPGSDPSRIGLKFAGANGLHIGEKGDLRMKTTVGEVGMGGLFAYQVVNGSRKQVDAKFQLSGKDRVGFKLGAYDRSKPLVIDPLVYGSYFGGDNGVDKVTGVVSEPDGAIYMTGYTKAPAFPVVQGAYQLTKKGPFDAFVTRFRGDAYNVDYNSYLGGSGSDVGLFIAMDPSGQSVYILGETNSTDLLPPSLQSKAYQANLKNGTDLFMFRFDKSGNTGLTPAYGTYFAPTTGDFDFTNEPVSGFGVTPAGTVLIAGTVTSDATFPKTNGKFSGDMFVSAFVNKGKKIKYTTRFGANGTLEGLAIDKTGGFFLSGTADTGFPLYNNGITNGLTIRGGEDAFVAKFNSETGAPIFSAAIGGSLKDSGSGCGVDQDGNVFVLGFSNSFDFPRTQGTYGQNMRGQVVLSKVRGDGSQILASTSLNTGNGEFDLKGVAIDGGGNVAVTGRIRASETYTEPPATVDSVPNPQVPLSAGTADIQVTQDTNPNGANYSLGNYAAKPTYTWVGGNAANRVTTWDGWVNVLDGNLTSLIYGSYIGGPNDEEIMPPYADLNGDIWLFGRINTAFLYISPGRPPAGGGMPPASLRVESTGGFFEDFTDPLRPRRVITPLAFKAVPEPGFGAFGGPGSNDETGSYEYANRDGNAYQITPTVPYGARVDGFVSRFRFSASVIANVTLSRAVVPGGLDATTTVTVNLSQAAPAQGADVRLDLSSIDFAQFQGSTNPSTVIVRIPAGATSGTATIVTKEVATPHTVTVTANYRGNVATNTITIVPWLTQITVTPNQTRGGFKTSATVTLAAAAPVGGITVNVVSSNPALASVDNGTVLVPEGQLTATVDVTTQIVATQTKVTLSATIPQLPKVTRTATLTLDPFGFNVASFTLSPSVVASGGTSTGTIMISTAAPDSGLVFSVTSLNPFATVPATVTIPAGATTASFTVTGGTPIKTATGDIVVSATNNPAISARQALTVNAVTFTISLSPSTIVGGQGSAVGTITLDNGAKATQDLYFDLTSPDTSLVFTPTRVMIPAGQSSVTFSVAPGTTAAEKPDVEIDATVTNADRSQTGFKAKAFLDVLAVRLLSFTVNPTTLRPLMPATALVTLEAPAPKGGVLVTLSLQTDLFQIYPTSLTVMVPEGKTTVSFPLASKRFSLPIKTTVTATAGGVAKSVLLTLQR
ncbi:hypothetical protein BH11ARM2_BH11ARM2_11490 [soil metagenome]